MNAHAGSSLDDFLKEEGLYDDTKTVAIKRVIAWQLQETMRQQGLTVTKMAALMNTSRTQVNRLLDPTCDVTLGSLQKAAGLVGRKLRVDLAPDDAAGTA